MPNQRTMKIGVAQVQSGADPIKNLAIVRSFIEEATRQNCNLVCFPENVLYRGPKKTETHMREDAFLERDGQGRLLQNSSFSKMLFEVLKNRSLTVSLGSVFEKSPNDPRPFNSHWVCHPNGKIDSYSKIHLFDFQSSAGVYQESAECQPGTNPVAVNINGWRTGLSICYDLRFPELFRKLTLKDKTDLLLIPAAFTRTTGQAHWHTLLRARAIENLSFVAAAGQWGAHQDSYGQELFCFGHSLIISPWGEILAEGPAEGDALITAELQPELLARYRNQLPALQSAKLF